MIETSSRSTSNPPHKKLTIAMRLPWWACGYRLVQERDIGIFFALGIVIILSLSLLNQPGFSVERMAGGFTSLSSTWANKMWGGGSLEYNKNSNFTLNTTDYVNLQQYFYLNPSTGSLILRDGVKSMSSSFNPLLGTPLRINSSDKKKTYLFVHFCDGKHPEDCSSEAVKSTRSDYTAHDYGIIEAKFYCLLLHQDANTADASQFRKAGFQQSISQMREVFGLSTIEYSYPKKFSCSHTLPNGLFAAVESAFKHKAAKTDSSIIDVTINVDKADPGTVIDWRMDSQQRTEANSSQVSMASPYNSIQNNLLAFIFPNPLILHLMIHRKQYLLLIGVLVPLAFYIMTFRNRSTRRSQKSKAAKRHLEPYLLLLGAQFATMPLAGIFLGEGLVVWVATYYTLLRVFQITGLIALSISKDSKLSRLFGLQRNPSLKILLWLELLVWIANLMFLGFHLLMVFSSFDYISPA